MKNKAALAVTAFFLVSVLPAAAATPNFSKAAASKPSVWEKPLGTLPESEHLVYEVFWMGVPVGFGELEVRKEELEGREVFHVIATARTNDVLSTLYPVHDEAHSYIDAKTLYPVEFRKKLSEGRYRADERTRFDPERRKGTYESVLNGSKKEFEISGQVHDILSAFYWFRRQDIRPGQSVKTTVSSEEKDWELRVEALRIERKELRGGEVTDTLVVEPKTQLKGMLYQRGRAWVWFGPDGRRTPLLIRFATPFGPVTGALRKSAEGAA